jgi:hypothetical protein
MNYPYKLASKNMNALITMTLNAPETFVKQLDDIPADNEVLGLKNYNSIWGLKNAVFFKYQGRVYILDLERWVLYTVINDDFILSKEIPEEGITGVDDVLRIRSYGVEDDSVSTAVIAHENFLYSQSVSD